MAPNIHIQQLSCAMVSLLQYIFTNHNKKKRKEYFNQYETFLKSGSYAISLADIQIDSS